MPKIIQLDPHLANLIAAGEVVERPASVVKELVENAIDAGAKTVTVELQNGGMTLLRVTDDGCGMSREDAKTAFLRHATSKLRTKEDLEAIGTLGFRGEALAATAAVSRIDLLTRTAEDIEGTHLSLEGGKILTCEAAGCPVGTTIVVRDLFFNTPARMKFMKRDTVEGSAAAGAVQKQALAHPEISFRLIKDGQPQLQTPGDGEQLAAIYAVLGRQAAGEMVPVDSKWEKLGVSGYVSRPTATRGTRANQIFFVNRRFIRSKTLTAALEEAYRNQLMVGRFPSCVLNISMPLTAVDVNVHPAKTEVKFLNEKEIFDCVHYGVLGALNRTPGQVPFQMQNEGFEHKAGSELRVQNSESAGADSVRPQVPVPPVGAAIGRPQAAATPQPDNRFFKAMSAEEYRKAAKPPVHTMTRWEYEQMTKTLQKNPMPPAGPALQEAVKAASLNSPVELPEDPDAVDSQQTGAPGQPQANEFPAPSASLRSAPSPQGEGIDAAPDATLPLAGVDKAPSFRYIGEAFRTYILVEQGDELILIDKHAAHERINFERLLAQGTQIVGQTLLQPLSCAFDREEAAVLLEHRDLLLSLGYDLDDLGQGDLLLRQIPSDIPVSDAAATLSEIADHLQKGRLDSPQRLRDEALHTIACKAAIKAGYITDPGELRRLAETVLANPDLKYCPHGRPICTVLTKRQVEKQFKRIT
ncbi:MAG: DNA mismatch repair endonuclease MutL [Oscillospiraceae bacterium]|nr:DNA mismatch repair endonuclease MutL [Oscillospiraceae bacterium]